MKWIPQKNHLRWEELWSQSWFSLFCGENLTFAASHVVLAEVWEGQEAGRSAVFQNVPSLPVGAIFNQRHQRGPIILDLPHQFLCTDGAFSTPCTTRHEYQTKNGALSFGATMYVYGRYLIYSAKLHFGKLENVMAEWKKILSCHFPIKAGIPHSLGSHYVESNSGS